MHFFVYTEHNRIPTTNYDFDMEVVPARVPKYIFNGRD